MTEQKSNVDESSKSPALKKKKRKEKKISFYTFTRKASALNQHKQYIMFLKMFLNS